MDRFLCGEHGRVKAGCVGWEYDAEGRGYNMPRVESLWVETERSQATLGKPICWPDSRWIIMVPNKRLASSFLSISRLGVTH